MSIDKTALLQRIDAMNAEMAGAAAASMDDVSELIAAAQCLREFQTVEAQFYSKAIAEIARRMLAAPVPPAPQAAVGNPVAVVDECDDGLFVDIIYYAYGSTLNRGDKLYAAPVLADLADEQIIEVADSVGARSCLREWYITFAHAILVATRSQS